VIGLFSAPPAPPPPPSGRLPLFSDCMRFVDPDDWAAFQKWKQDEAAKHPYAFWLGRDG